MPNFLIDEDTGVLAAEFVLGTLDSAERANAHSLLKADHGFIAMVRIWERRFGDLHLMVEPVDPDAKIFERIKAKLPVTAAEGAPTPDTQKTAAAPASGEAPNPPPVAAAVTAEAPKPPEASAPPAATPAAERTIAPAPTLPPAADLPPPRPPENRAPPAKGAAPIPAPQPPPSLKLPDKAPDRFQDGRAKRSSEITIDVIRSRRRWRAFGIFMILAVLAMGGLVAAWRVVPDRLPPQLRPSAVMMAIGLEPGATTPNAAERKPAPPESQFDE
jgi:hypothetical protein